MYVITKTENSDKRWRFTRLRCNISFVSVSSALLRATFSRCYDEIIWLNYIIGATHKYTYAASHTSYFDEDKSHNFSQRYTLKCTRPNKFPLNWRLEIDSDKFYFWPNTRHQTGNDPEKINDWQFNMFVLSQSETDQGVIINCNFKTDCEHSMRDQLVTYTRYIETCILPKAKLYYFIILWCTIDKLHWEKSFDCTNKTYIIEGILVKSNKNF